MKREIGCGVLALVTAACSASPSARTRDRADEGAAQPQATVSGSSWTRFGWDVGRSNASTAATGITSANVGSLIHQQVQIDGTVDASAIYLAGATVKGATHDALFVTTTYGKTLAIDASSGSVLWTYTPSDYSSWAGSYQITTATPVADPDGQSIYATSPDGHIQKLAVADGSVAWSTAITMLAAREKIAASLNFFNGRVIATTGGYIGDAPPYQGHVVILAAATGALLHTWNSLCSDRAGLIDPRSCGQSDSAIWGRAGAVIDSTTGNIFVATGNGHWDGQTFWGDATLELDPDATRVLGSYTPANTDVLDARDLDLGSTSPVLLGGGLILQGGKDGTMRLLSIQQMEGSGSHRGGEAQTVSTPSGDDLFTAPAVVHASDGSTWIFAADNGATTGWLLRDGLLQQQWRNPVGGTSPVVAGGLLYVYSPGGGLRIYDPPTGKTLATLDCGAGHWNSPIIADGRIVLPEGNANQRQLTGVLNIWRVPLSRTPRRRP